MGIKTFNPYTPSRRHMTRLDFAEITKSTPEKSLTYLSRKQLVVTIRVKSQLDTMVVVLEENIELSTFKRNKDGIPATVMSIEYDPNRTANIALICYADGEKSYIIAPKD